MTPKLPEGLTLPGAGTKFGAGVLGKTSHVALGCVGIWGIVAWRLDGNLYKDGALIFVGAIVTIFAAWWTRSSQIFAADNPAQALLEGASLVALRRAEMQAKGGALIENQPVELSPETLIDHTAKSDD